MHSGILLFTFFILSTTTTITTISTADHIPRNGHESNPNRQWPFLAIMHSIQEDQDNEILPVTTKNPSGRHCTAIIWNRQNLLTAAHCVNNSRENVFLAAKQIGVYLGDQNLMLTVKKVVVHEDWNAEMIDNDIALLHLTRPIGSSITPVPQPLPLSRLNRSSCVTLGWSESGQSGQVKLHEAEIIAESCDPECIDEFGKVRSGDIVKQKGGCSGGGDSGGGLLVCSDRVDPQKYHLVGLLGSLGSDLGCEAGVGSSYGTVTRVEHYHEWIERNAEVDFSGTPTEASDVPSGTPAAEESLKHFSSLDSFLYTLGIIVIIGLLLLLIVIWAAIVQQCTTSREIRAKYESF